MERIIINRILLVGVGKMGFGIAKFLQGYNNRFDILDVNKENERKCLDAFSNAATEDSHSLYDTVILSLAFNDLKDFIFKNHNRLFKKEKVFLTITRPDYSNSGGYENFNKFLVEHNISLICGLGLEPGLTELCSQILLEKNKDVSNLEIYCGGVPLSAEPPLYYNIVFGNKLAVDPKKAFVKTQNNIFDTRRFEGLSDVFIKNIGLLESYHDGLIPFFAKCVNVPNLSQKTLRWKGFTNAVKILRECGMLSEAKLPEYNISPERFLHSVLKNNTLVDAKDIVILYIKADSKTFLLLSKGDSELSGMAKTTAFPICFALNILNQKTIKTGITWAFDFFNTADVKVLLKKMEEENIVEIYE